MENCCRKHRTSGSCLDPAPSPQKIFDQDKYVYLYDSTGVYVFDYYGALKNKILISTGRILK